MRITSLEIPGVMLVVPKRFDDARGYFAELYNAKQLEDAGIRDVFVQDNLFALYKFRNDAGASFSGPAPWQAKLVRVSEAGY